MEHTGKLRDNCEKRKVQLQKCGRFCKSRWNTGTAASPFEMETKQPCKGKRGCKPRKNIARRVGLCKRPYPRVSAQNKNGQL